MNNTVLKYMRDSELYEDSAKVLAINEREDGKKIVILDSTIFYPQGGGQPYDTGQIKSNNAVYNVEEVRFVDGFVQHIGEFENGTFQQSQEVACYVDADRRKLNCRLHSAGHLIDTAIEKLGQNWMPIRGHHFPGECYVKYDSAVEDIESFKDELEAELNRLIQIGVPVEARQMTKNELRKVSKYIPDMIPEGKPCRASIFVFSEEEGGEKGTACGGTHVKNLREIGKMIITGIKIKKGQTKISYDLA